MSRKVHLQANAAVSQEPFAMCASRLNGRGRVEFNNRRTYTGMGSEIVRTREFIETPANQRCGHCCDVLRQRKGLLPKTYSAIWGDADESAAANAKRFAR